MYGKFFQIGISVMKLGCESNSQLLEEGWDDCVLGASWKFMW